MGSSSPLPEGCEYMGLTPCLGAETLHLPLKCCLYLHGKTLAVELHKAFLSKHETWSLVTVLNRRATQEFACSWDGNASQTSVTPNIYIWALHCSECQYARQRQSCSKLSRQHLREAELSTTIKEVKEDLCSFTGNTGSIRGVRVWKKCLKASFSFPQREEPG